VPAFCVHVPLPFSPPSWGSARGELFPRYCRRERGEAPCDTTCGWSPPSPHTVRGVQGIPTHAAQSAHSPARSHPRPQYPAHSRASADLSAGDPYGYPRARTGNPPVARAPAMAWASLVVRPGPSMAAVAWCWQRTRHRCALGHLASKSQPFPRM
jgi:hypothetical protein